MCMDQSPSFIADVILNAMDIDNDKIDCVEVGYPLMSSYLHFKFLSDFVIATVAYTVASVYRHGNGRRWLWFWQ